MDGTAKRMIHIGLADVRHTSPKLMALEFWPYIICVAVVILGGLFAQGRVALLAVLLAVFTLLLAWLGIHRPDPFRLDVAVFAASIYIPVLTSLFYFLRERGLWNSFGAIRSIAVILVLFFFFLISGLVMPNAAVTFRQEIWLRGLVSWLPVPLMGLMALAGAVATLQIRRPSESPHLKQFLSAMLVAVFAGLMFRPFISRPPLAGAILFIAMSVAALCLLMAVIEGAWRHAFIDELTELPSRRALRHHFVSLNGEYVIAIIDIDHFKAINDQHGHATGDQVLRFIASTLRTSTVGRIYRQGGEEFVVIIENIKLARAAELLDALRATIAARPFGIRDLQARPARISGAKPSAPPQRHVEAINVTVSIGLAHAAPGVDTPDDVLAAADKALYRAKQDGRNLVRIAR